MVGPAAGRMVGPAAGRMVGPAAGRMVGPAGVEASDTGVPPAAAVVRGSAADLAEAVDARVRPSVRMIAAWLQ
jgi:hypothetical protein